MEHIARTVYPTRNGRNKGNAPPARFPETSSKLIHPKAPPVPWPSSPEPRLPTNLLPSRAPRAHAPATRDPGPAAPGRRVAVIGTGVAGLVAAWRLSSRHRVDLYEAGERPGGHTHTVTLDRGPDRGLAVDTGFIVYNEANYPIFTRLLAGWNVATQETDMSFSFEDEGSGFCWAGHDAGGLFARARNAVDPSFWSMLAGIAAFQRAARRDLPAGLAAGLTLGAYLDALGLPRATRERYLLPMGAAIWSCPAGHVESFPAEAFLRFFANHGLLTLTKHPRWRTITGGSETYVRALLSRFAGSLHLRTPVRSVTRTAAGVRIATDEGTRTFDDVVIATHADQALALLADADPRERRLLGAWRYSLNPTVLHRDRSFLPARRRAWAAWNVRRSSADGPDAPVRVTYHMNRLQRLATRQDYCVTLHPARPIPDEHVLARMTYTHPIYTFDSLATHRELPALNGSRRTWFCGSYFGWGFHEDAVRSACAVAAAFGAAVPGAVV